MQHDDHTPTVVHDPSLVDGNKLRVRTTALEAEGLLGNKVFLRYTEVVHIPGPDDDFEPGLYAGVEAWHPATNHEGVEIYPYIWWLPVRIGPVPEDPLEDCQSGNGTAC